LSPGLPSSGVNRGLVAGSGGSGANIGAEGWSSALAEAPSALMGGLAAINGTSVADPSITSVSSVSSGTTVVTTSGTSANPTKMVDALVQNPPRFHAPPQQSAEKQRLEELALKQSRQLIPMKPSLPKNMVSSSYLLQWAVLSQSSLYPDVGGCHSVSSFVGIFDI
jgi:hypothetical protein